MKNELQHAHTYLKSFICHGIDPKLVGKSLRIINQTDKLARAQSQNSFLLTCRKENLFPKTLDNKYRLPECVVNNKNVVRSLGIFKRVLLNGLIDNSFYKIRCHQDNLNSLYSSDGVLTDVEQQFVNEVFIAADSVYNSRRRICKKSHLYKLFCLRQNKRKVSIRASNIVKENTVEPLHNLLLPNLCGNKERKEVQPLQTSSKGIAKPLSLTLPNVVTTTDKPFTDKPIDHLSKGTDVTILKENPVEPFPNLYVNKERKEVQPLQISSKFIDKPLSLTSSKVVVTTDKPVSDKSIELLSKGPDFAIAPSKHQKEIILRETEIALDRMTFQLRWQESKTDHNILPHRPSSATNLNELLTHAPFDKWSKQPPLANSMVECNISHLKSQIMKTTSKHISVATGNISKEEKEAIMSLKSDDDIIIKRTDKSKSISIQNKNDYINKIKSEHLNDTNTYEKLPDRVNPITTIENKLKSLWSTISKRNLLAKKHVEMMKPHESKPGEFYGLLKDHKKTDDEGLFPQRPVVSGIDTPTEKLSWLLEKVLHVLLPYVPAHLDSEDQFISILQEVESEVTSDDILFSLDVVALYPSIPIDDAISKIIRFAGEHKEEIEQFGILLPEIEEGLRLILHNNIFRFGNDLYKQKRGVAMGNRLAPTVAILFMHFIESRGLDTCSMRPAIFKRYIDDCFGIWKHGRKSLDEFLAHMNSINPFICFTMETDQETGWLNYLRFSLRSNDGFIDRTWYRKTSARDIFLHSDSHHSEETKHNVIVNQFRCIEHICSSEEFYYQSSKRFKDILLSNGYSVNVITHLEQRARSIYKFLDFRMKDSSQTITIPDRLVSFFKCRNLTVQSVKGDGHCLLHSVSASTGIHLSEIKNTILTEFERDPVAYSIGAGNEAQARNQLVKYFSDKLYNLPIVDVFPLLIAKGLGRSLFIFESRSSKTLILKIAPAKPIGQPILLKKTGDHYDCVHSKSKWTGSRQRFKRKFDNCAIIKIPFVNDAHCREVKHIVQDSMLPVLPIFVPGKKLIHQLTKTALDPPVCQSKGCILKGNKCFSKNTVYELACSLCDERYVGESQRCLHTRIKEHNKAVLMGETKSAMGDHYNTQHHSAPDIPFTTTILDKGANFIDRKIREAWWIRQKKPKLNRDNGWDSLLS